MQRIYLCMFKYKDSNSWDVSFTSEINTVNKYVNTTDADEYDYAVFALDQLPRIIGMSLSTQEQWQMPQPPAVTPSATESEKEVIS